MNREECLAIINTAREKNERVDLSGADLSGANLSDADLRDANLRDANLSRANLSGANLSDADLSGADLRRADLSDADLSDADLSGADLSSADLSSADLSSADLSDANLRDANLSCANLYGADLSDANLRGANLRGANLRGANLGGADLSSAKGIELALARASHLSEGPMWGWKKCMHNVIVKLLIPAEARRSHGAGRKCRAEFADVLEVIGAEVGISGRDDDFKYEVGKRAISDSWDENRWDECSHGIHFFVTRAEAEEYQL
jgi:hypothetical protein